MLESVKIVRDCILRKDAGIGPVTPFPPKANWVKNPRFPMELGKGPTTLLLVRSRPTIENPVLQETPYQLLIHGSPISQFAELFQATPFVEA